MRKGKRLSTVLLIVICLLTTAGNLFAKGETEESNLEEKVTLTVWADFTGLLGKSFTNVCDEFMKENPNIIIDFVPVGQNDIHAKIGMAIRGNQSPDVFVRKGLPEYASQGLLLDLEDYFAEKGFTEDTFHPGFWNTITWDGVPYGMPTQAALPLLYYNKEMYEEAGLDPEDPPQTWEELMDYNRVLTKYDDQGAIIQAGFDFRGLWWNDMYMFHFGVDSIYDEQSHKWGAPQGVYDYLKAIEAYRDEYGSDKLNNFHASTDTWEGIFVHNKVAMQLQGEWFNNVYKEFESSTNFGTTLFPSIASVVKENNGSMIYMEDDIAMIPVNTKHPDEAFEFLAYFCGYNGQKVFDVGEEGCGRSSALADADYYGTSPNPFIEDHIDALEIGLNRKFQFPKSPVIEYYRQQMAAMFDEIFVSNGDACALYDKYIQRVQDAEDKYWLTN